LGVTVALTVWATAGASTVAAAAIPQDTFRAAVRATRDASSFIMTMRQGGYHPPDSGDTGPVTLAYQAPDRFHSVQRMASEPGTNVTTIQIGHDHYQQDSTHPNVWMHNTLPPGEPGWGSILTNTLDPLAKATVVSRNGNTYQLSPSTRGSSTAEARAVAKIAHGRLASLDLRVNTGPGKTQEQTMTFSHFGDVPEIRAPTGDIQEGG
jgi:hypothetical protein